MMSDSTLSLHGRATYDAGEATLVGVSLQQIGNEDATLEFLAASDDSVRFGLLRLPDGQRIIAHMAWPVSVALEITLRNLGLCDRLFGKRASNAIVRAQQKQMTSRQMDIGISDVQFQAHQDVIAEYGG